MKTTRPIQASLMLAAGLMLSAAASQAAISYHVTIDTSTLVSSSSGPFSIDFQLNGGDDTVGNNTAIISSFTYGGGGAPFGAPNTFGDASGSLDTNTVSLTDTTAFNEFFQSFTAGSVLEFNLFLTQNASTGSTPDSFSIAILDSTLSNIATNSADGANTLLHLDITSASAGNNFADLNLASGVGAYSGTALAIPEPSSALCGVLAIGLGLLRRRRNA